MAPIATKQCAESVNYPTLSAMVYRLIKIRETIRVVL